MSESPLDRLEKISQVAEPVAEKVHRMKDFLWEFPELTKMAALQRGAFAVLSHYAGDFKFAEKVARDVRKLKSTIEDMKFENEPDGQYFSNLTDLHDYYSHEYRTMLREILDSYPDGWEIGSGAVESSEVNVDNQEPESKTQQEPEQEVVSQESFEGRWDDERLVREADWVSLLGEGIRAVRLDNSFFLVDENGDRVGDYVFESVEPFKDGQALVTTNGLKYFVGLKGKVNYMLGGYDDARSYSNGRAAVCRDGRWYFIDTEGYMLRNPFGASKYELPWNEIRDYSEGRAAVRLGNSWCYIDESGFVTSDYYEVAEQYVNGVARVMKDGRWMLLDLNGKEVSDDTLEV